jgi:hypothetical protein
VIFEHRKTYAFRHIFPQHWYTCPIALPVRRNPQHRSLLTVISATCAPPFQTFRHQRYFATFLDPVMNRFTREILPTVNRKHLYMNILCTECFGPQKAHYRTLLLGNTLLKNGRHFDNWNQPLNMRMHVCYLDWQEAGLCCYQVIHIGNLVRPLQLFYFHLWPIYWPPLTNISKQETPVRTHKAVNTKLLLLGDVNVNPFNCWQPCCTRVRMVVRLDPSRVIYVYCKCIWCYYYCCHYHHRSQGNSVDIFNMLQAGYLRNLVSIPVRTNIFLSTIASTNSVKWVPRGCVP